MLPPADREPEAHGQAAASFSPQEVPEPVGAAGASIGEEELWWGGYSPLEALPGLLVGVVLTGLLAWCAWQFLPPPWTRVVFRGSAGALWLMLLGRLLWRFLGTNYRLTTRRLFIEHGLFSLNRRRAVLLADIVTVVPRQHFWERWWDGGRLYLKLADGSQLLLTGLRQPQTVAHRILKEIGYRHKSLSTAPLHKGRSS